MASFEIPIRVPQRKCVVDGRPGYFHLWEQYSEVVAPSLLMGGHPGRTISRVFGIVEFADGVQRINPCDIKFVDEDHLYLAEAEKLYYSEGNQQ